MPAVPAPESAIKRAAFKQQQTENFKKAVLANKEEKKALTKTAYQRGLKYSREYRSAERKLITLRRQAKSNGNFYLEAAPKIAVVTRIRGIAQVAPKQKKILQLLRLRQIFNTVIVNLGRLEAALWPHGRGAGVVAGRPSAGSVEHLHRHRLCCQFQVHAG